MDAEDRLYYFWKWLVWAIEFREDLVRDKTMGQLVMMYDDLEDPYELD